MRRTPRYALTVMVFDCLTVRSVDRKHDNPKDMQDFHLDSRSVHETFGILVLQISSNSLLSVTLLCWLVLGLMRDLMFCFLGDSATFCDFVCPKLS